MKIKVTYDKEDILQLIHKDLRANGLKHDLSTAAYKGSATVTVEVEGTPSEDEPFDRMTTPVPAAPEQSRETKAPAPPRDEPAEEPVADMSAILAQSQKNAASNKPLYPAGHTLMDGETTEWPGVPEQRNR